MSQLRQPVPRPLLRQVILGAGLLLAIGAAARVGLYFWPGDTGGPTPAPSRTAGGPAEAAPPRPAAPPPAAPAFDIVRVSPEGRAVIAGTATPDQTVTIRDGDTDLGHATADAAGQWVLTPDQPLRPGARELTLAARTPQGGETPGQGSVLLVVPDRPPAGLTAQGAAPHPPGTALAVLTPQPGSAAAPRLLQAPGPAGPGARLDLEVVDYDDHGAVNFAGHAPPGARLRVYVDNKPVADAVADPQARWSEKPGTIAPGQHRVRIDQLDAGGRVVSRIELPFIRETAAAQTIAPGQVVVQPGATLWRLARNAYGQGTRYTVIYAFNSGVIRNPDLIYPGQIFTIPDAAIAATSPPVRATAATSPPIR